MLEQIRDIFFEYAPWAVFIPWLLALLSLQGYTPALKTVFYYLTLAVCTHLLSFILWKLKKNNLPVLHVYTVLEYLVLLRFYYLVLKSFIPGTVFIALVVIFPLFSIADSLFIENIHSFNTYSRSVEALIFIFLSVCWFVKSVSDPETNENTNRPLNHIAGGLLIYFAGSVVLFSFRDLISQFTRSFLMNVWSLHTLLLFLMYILITTGLWKHSRK
jgi:hypothetical protein